VLWRHHGNTNQWQGEILPMTSLLPMKNPASKAASVAKSPRRQTVKQSWLNTRLSYFYFFFYQIYLSVKTLSTSIYIFTRQSCCSCKIPTSNGKGFKNLQINNKHALFFVLFKTLSDTWSLHKLYITKKEEEEEEEEEDYSTSIHNSLNPFVDCILTRG